MRGDFDEDELDDDVDVDVNGDFQLHLLEGDDCGIDRRGECGKAGSEECEFACPYRGARRQP